MAGVHAELLLQPFPTQVVAGFAPHSSLMSPWISQGLPSGPVCHHRVDGFALASRLWLLMQLLLLFASSDVASLTSGTTGSRRGSVKEKG